MCVVCSCLANTLHKVETDRQTDKTNTTDTYNKTHYI